MNEYDSDRISDIVKQTGYIKTNNSNNTDCYVLNTCHIREKATEKVYHDIGRLKKNYRNKKKPVVLVTGCVAQAENEEMLKREPYIDAVIGPQSYQNIEKILQDINNKNERLNYTDFDVIEKFDKLNTLKNLNSKVSSFITIQEGCDKFCHFCVVPYTRGSEHSRSPVEIIKEAKNLISNGAAEITLLGQNVNAYNYNFGKKTFKLSDILKELHNLDGLQRIRYTTSHPKDMTKDLIECYKDLPKLMPFLHLPVQTGSNNILKKMNRKHTIEEYLLIIDDLLDIRPEIKFSSDFIVGYPGESDKDFDKTISLIKKVKFINSYSYIYNKRPGTPSAKMKQISNDVQKKRLNELQNLLENYQKTNHKNNINNSLEVLVENKLKNQNKFFGRTKNLTPVIFSNGDVNDIGKTISIFIENYNRNSLFGIKKTNDEIAA